MTANERTVKECNLRLEQECGRNPFGEGIYKWVHAPALVHRKPNGEATRGFPWMGRSWCLAIWQYLSEDEWRAKFGEDYLWPPRGYYFPTNQILLPGAVPSIEFTNYFIHCIRRTRERSFRDFMQAMRDRFDRTREESFRQTHEMVLDAMTAFGNDPGKRSGGVSFPSAGSNLKKEEYVSPDRFHLPRESEGDTALQSETG